LPIELLQPYDWSADSVFVSVGLDWVHNTLELAERIVFGLGGRFVGTCYDLIPLTRPEWVYPSDAPSFRRHLERLARVASTILAISESTKDELLEHLPGLSSEQIRVITLGSDPPGQPSAEHDQWVRTNFGHAPYAVYCSTIDRRKNHKTLYRAMQDLIRSGIDGNIVFVGAVGHGMEDFLETVMADPIVACRIAHVLNCDDDYLSALYRNASFAVYPSFYEGWGLGVTEALAHGTPCIIASGSSLREAGLGACREIDPFATGEWAACMADSYEAPPVVTVGELPTWARTADQVLDACCS
jgi:glycosyltransferase involved in cell wall biosynthesis